MIVIKCMKVSAVEVVQYILRRLHAFFEVILATSSFEQARQFPTANMHRDGAQRQKWLSTASHSQPILR